MMQEEKGAKKTIATAISESAIQLEDLISSFVQTSQEDILITTVPILQACLKDALEEIGKRKTWAPPLGILLTLVITVATTESYKSILGLSSELWKALLVLCTLAALVWFVCSIVQLARAKSPKKISKELVEQVKKRHT